MPRIGSLKRSGTAWDKEVSRRAHVPGPVLRPGTAPLAEAGRRSEMCRQWDGILEPALHDVFADPVVWQVMERDGLTLHDLTAMVRRTRERLASQQA